MQSPVDDLSIRGAGYAIPSEIVDGNDFIAVYRAVAKAVERARRGEGPTIIEAKTYRIEGFSTSDMGGYQSEDDLAAWKARDPLVIAARTLAEVIGEDKVKAVFDGAIEEVDTAVETALTAPLPTFAVFEKTSPYSEAV